MGVFDNQRRRMYKLLSWDYVTHEGVATDGTKFDHEPITFKVLGADLPEEYNDILIIGEVFSAEEGSDHHTLHDVIIERGPRARAPLLPEEMAALQVQETPLEQTERAQGILDEIIREAPPVVSGGLLGTLANELEGRVACLESRVGKLERKALVVDDHR